jgi:hypothetical protein
MNETSACPVCFGWGWVIDPLTPAPPLGEPVHAFFIPCPEPECVAHGRPLASLDVAQAGFKAVSRDEGALVLLLSDQVPDYEERARARWGSWRG